MWLSETECLLREQFRRYLAAELEPMTAQLESGEELPYPFLRRMVADLGLAEPHGEGTPEDRKLGGRARMLLTVELARINPGLAMSYGASVDLCAGNIARLGTDEQLHRFVAPLRCFEKIGAWCLTEPQAGSDAFRSMKTTATQEGDDFVLKGTKTFITNAPHADVLLVYAKEKQDDSIQAFIVEREFPGVSVGPPFEKMGMKSSPTGAVFFDAVRVPKQNRLGLGVRDRSHVRKSLTAERAGIAVLSYGIAERCFEIARDYARERVQGGQPIANYQLIQGRLARMYVTLTNVRRFVFGRHEDLSAGEISAAKLYAAEAGTFVATEAIHILGGYGYLREYAVERLARDAKLLELGGGTTEMQILTIARHLLSE
ncbi:MAG: acyl-CoA dehydrogenase family protein [Myxococcota bacterium]